MTQNMQYLNSSLNITQKGIYKWDTSFSFMGTANHEYDLAVGINGIPGIYSHAHRKIGTGNDVGNAGSTGLLDLQKGDIITLMIEDHTDTGNVYMDTGSLTLTKINEDNPTNISIQYSTDNTTWNDIHYLLINENIGIQPILLNTTTYYFRGKNSSCNYTYINTTTHEGGAETVNDAIVIIAITLIFIYLVLYKKNRLLGNIGYLGTGISVLLYDTTTIIDVSGLIITSGAIISLIYDLFRKA